jgi:hypothetical protein
MVMRRSRRRVHLLKYLTAAIKLVTARTAKMYIRKKTSIGTNKVGKNYNNIYWRLNYIIKDKESEQTNIIHYYTCYLQI